MRKELPHLLKKGMSHEAFVKAVRENFEALAGETFLINTLIFGGGSGGDTTLIEAAANAAAGSFVQNVIEQLEEAGVGPEDGAPPADAPTNLQAQGGIGDWFIVLWDGVENTSGVTYKVYADTINGFTPASNTLVGTFTIPGGATDRLGTLLVKKFPSTHRLPNHTVNSSTTYYVKVSASDGDGEGPASSQVSVTPLVVDANSILAAGTIVGNLIAGSTIVGSKIAGSTITADKLSVSTLSAITANLGTIVAGTINGVDIIGGTFKSAASGDKITIGFSDSTSIIWQNNSGAVNGFIDCDNSKELLIAGGSLAGSGVVTIVANDAVNLSGPVKFESGTMNEVTNSSQLASSPTLTNGGATALPEGATGGHRPNNYWKVELPGGITGYIPVFT